MLDNRARLTVRPESTHKTGAFQIEEIGTPAIYITQFTRKNVSMALPSLHRHNFQEIIWVQAGHARWTRLHVAAEYSFPYCKESGSCFSGSDRFDWLYHTFYR